MLRKDFIISKTRNYMAQFINPIAIAADKPRRKFLREVLGAILISGSLVVMEFSRLIQDDCSDIFYRLKRLLNHLTSPRGDLSVVVQAYRQQMARYIQPDTPLIIDMTDIAKARAKGMEYLNLVRDGSEGKLVNGYWCTEIYAYVEGKKVVPLCLDAFSIDDPCVGSQNLQIEGSIEAINRALNGNGIWMADCPQIASRDSKKSFKNSKSTRDFKSLLLFELSCKMRLLSALQREGKLSLPLSVKSDSNRSACSVLKSRV